MPLIRSRFFICGILFFTGLLSAQTDSLTTEPQTQEAIFSAAKSVVLPGWGQHANQQPGKGYVFAGIETATLASAITLNQLAHQSTDPYMRGYYEIGRDMSVWIFGSTLVMSAVDAFRHTTPVPDTKNPTGAMIRSILIPGWGQFYNGRWLKGAAIAAVEIGTVVNAMVLDLWGDQTDDEMEKLFYYDNRNLSYWILGGTILYGMADAFVDAHLYKFDESPDLTFNTLRQRDRFTGIAYSSWKIMLAVQL